MNVMAKKKKKEKKQLEALRERLEEERAQKGVSFEAKKAKETVDLEKVDRIVSKMRKKYKKKGLEVEEGVEARRLKELRGVIAGGPRAALTVQTVDKLKESKKKESRHIGAIQNAL